MTKTNRYYKHVKNDVIELYDNNNYVGVLVYYKISDTWLYSGSDEQLCYTDIDDDDLQDWFEANRFKPEHKWTIGGICEVVKAV